MRFIRFLSAYLAVSLLRPLVRPIVWAVVLALATAAPAELWKAYIDPHPSPELLATLTVTTFAALVGTGITLIIRRRTQRRHMRRAVSYVLDVAKEQ